MLVELEPTLLIPQTWTTRENQMSLLLELYRRSNIKENYKKRVISYDRSERHLIKKEPFIAGLN